MCPLAAANLRHGWTQTNGPFRQAPANLNDFYLAAVERRFYWLALRSGLEGSWNDIDEQWRSSVAYCLGGGGKSIGTYLESVPVGLSVLFDMRHEHAH